MLEKMISKFCNQRLLLWKSEIHLQNTHNITRLYPIVSLPSNLKSSSWCYVTTRLYLREIHISRLEFHRQGICRLIPPKCQASYPIIYSSHEDNISRATLIWRAIKLPIYSVAFVPLSVGTAAAYLQTGLWSAKQYGLLLASSILIITWLNLSNDVYDFDTGADINKKESVVNMIGSRSGTLMAALLLLGLGLVGLGWAAMEAGNVRSMLLLASAIACGYIYQCPPFRLSYRGLGEPLCFSAFGPFATTGFYLLQGSTASVEMLPITGTILSASILVGITTSLILFSSHFHQVSVFTYEGVDPSYILGLSVYILSAIFLNSSSSFLTFRTQISGDKAVGKLSPLVRIGTETGSNVVKMAVIFLYSLLLVLGIFKALPITSIFLCALTAPMGKLVVSFVENNHQDKTKIFMAKYFCVRLHTLFGAALAVGLVAARIIARNHNQYLLD